MMSCVSPQRHKKTLLTLVFLYILWSISIHFTEFDIIEGLLAIPRAVLWMYQHFIPDAKSLIKLPNILSKLAETLLMSIAATTIGAFFAFCLSFFGSVTTSYHKIFSFMARSIGSIFRNIPDAVWAMILLLSFGQHILTGYLAMFFVSFGFLTRVFIETLDEVDPSLIEGLESVGATYIQVIFHGILPTVQSQFLNWTLYMVETNIRSSTLIGMLTGTGIGFLFDVYYKSTQYRVTGLIVLVITLTILCIEYISNNIKKGLTKNSKIHAKGLFLCLFCLTSLAFISIDIRTLQLNQVLLTTLNHLQNMFLQVKNVHLPWQTLFHSLLVTLSLAFITTFVGGTIALFLSFFAARNLSSAYISVALLRLMSIIRAIPTILWVLIFAICIGLGSEAAIIGMCFHTIGYLVKAYSHSIEDMDKGVLEALRASGANWLQIIFQGVLPTTMRSLVAWTFLRFEINFANAVVMGAAAGAGGIGFELFMASRLYFNMSEVGLITLLILAIIIVLEYSGTFIKHRSLR